MTEPPEPTEPVLRAVVPVADERDDEGSHQRAGEEPDRAEIDRREPDQRVTPDGRQPPVDQHSEDMEGDALEAPVAHRGERARRYEEVEQDERRDADLPSIFVLGV